MSAAALQEFIVDLHVHTCLSACAEPSMIPPAIVAYAKQKHLDAIGITDHNAALNVGAVMEAGCNAGDGLVVFGGMEIHTQEEIHLLALFEDLETTATFSRTIDSHLEGVNDPDRFGEQYIVDWEGYVTGICDSMLSSAVDLSIEKVVEAIHERNGIAIAAHIDRETFSVVSQLGFIPDTLELDAVELSRNASSGYATEFAGRLQSIASSDAHSPADIGACSTIVECEKLTFDELKLALQRVGGRSVRPQAV